MTGGPCGCGSSTTDVRADSPLTRRGTGDPVTPYILGLDCSALMTGCVGDHLGLALKLTGDDIDVKVSSQPDNLVQIVSDGIYIPPAANTGIVFGDTASTNISGSGTVVSPVITDVLIGPGLDVGSSGVEAKVSTWSYPGGRDSTAGQIFVDSSGALRSEPVPKTGNAFIGSGATRSTTTNTGGVVTTLSGGTYTNRLTLTNPDSNRSMTVNITAGTRLLITHDVGNTASNQFQILLKLTVGSTSQFVQAFQVNHGTAESIGPTNSPFPPQTIAPGATMNVTAEVQAISGIATGFTWNDPTISAIGVSN